MHDYSSKYVSILYDICTECIPQTSGKPHNRPTNPWWTPECSKAIQHRDNCLRRWKQAFKYHRNLKQERKDEYNQAKKTATETLFNARTEGWRDFISEIDIQKRKQIHMGSL